MMFMGVEMDIQKLRQEFEKLPDIKGILHGSDFCFNESLNQYYHPDHTNHRLSYAFIMGAWMVWKAQAVPEGFVLVPVDQLNQWGHMANYAEQYGCCDCFESRGYAHNLACEINSYFEPAEAQEQSHD